MYKVPAVTGATSYTWTLPNGWTGTSTNDSISAMAGTTGGNITVMATNACGSSTAQTLAVTTNVVDTAVARSGLMLTAHATGANYQWFNCGTSTLISGQTNKIYTATASGSYAVIITQNGCKDTSSCYSVKALGIDEISPEMSFSIFPNPSSGKFQVAIDGSQFSKRCTLEIYNICGEQIYQSVITNSKSEIDLSNYANGIYFVKCSNGQTLLTAKFIKE
jgi:hypothetical protein